jgi:hypothetical protein
LHIYTVSSGDSIDLHELCLGDFFGGVIVESDCILAVGCREFNDCALAHVVIVQLFCYCATKRVQIIYWEAAK